MEPPAALSPHAEERIRERELDRALVLRIANDAEPGVKRWGQERTLPQADGSELVVRFHGSTQQVSTAFVRTAFDVDRLWRARITRGV